MARWHPVSDAFRYVDTAERAAKMFGLERDNLNGRDQRRVEEAVCAALHGNQNNYLSTANWEFYPELYAMFIDAEGWCLCTTLSDEGDLGDDFQIVDCARAMPWKEAQGITFFRRTGEWLFQPVDGDETAWMRMVPLLRMVGPLCPYVDDILWMKVGPQAEDAINTLLGVTA